MLVLRGLFLGGNLDGVPVASGGWRCVGPDDDAALEPGDAQIKRMIAELERTAAQAGRRRAVLETGGRQPEAIRLYESSGYLSTSPFGSYRDAPNARHDAKPLPVPAATRARDDRG